MIAPARMAPTSLGTIVIATALTATGCARLSKPPALWFEKTSHATSVSANADGLTALEVRGGMADIRVIADTAERLQIVTSLRSSDAERLNKTCVPSARLDTVRSNGVLSVRVYQSSRDRCGESWSITMPKRLHIALDFTNADAEVQGLGGGLRMSAMGTGKIRGSVERGDVDVRVGVGDVELTIAQREYAAVSLESEVGSVHLKVGGYDVPRGEKRGAGQRISLTGAGTGRVSARSRVGDVRVTLGSSQ